MITSAFISILRRKYEDSPEKHQDLLQGDGSSTVYKTQYFPIIENSVKLYKGNALQAASGYTLDYDTGDIVLEAPTSAELKIQYQAATWRDQNWLEAIQFSFQQMGNKFFRIETRKSGEMSLSAGVTVYDCPSSCIRLIEALASTDYTSGGTYIDLATNHRYDRSSNKLILGNKPVRGNYMLISYARKLSPPSSVNDSLDVEDRWLSLLDLKSGASYLRSLAVKLAQQGNATIEQGYLSVAQVRTLANDNEVLYQAEEKKLKPLMPPRAIPFYLAGGGAV